MIANSQQRRKRLRKKCYSFFFSKGHLLLIFVMLQIKVIHRYLIMSHTIDRVLYNSVENSSCGHFPYPRKFLLFSPPIHQEFPLVIRGGGGGGLYGYFMESHISKPAALDIIMRGSNGLIALHYYRPKQQEILEACIYKCGYVLHALSRFEMNIDDSRSIGLFSLPCNN